MLCNGIVIFEDTGELLPGGRCIDPHRPTDLVFKTTISYGHPGHAPAA